MTKEKEDKQMPTNNFVAKHARKFNKAHVHVDRKKADKRGKRKHKRRYEE